MDTKYQEPNQCYLNLFPLKHCNTFLIAITRLTTDYRLISLRIFALIPLALSIFTARRLIYLPRDIHVTSSTLTLTTHLLIANPFLLALSPAILLVSLIGSVPFLTLVFRLLLYGYAGQILSGSSRIEGHLHAWANWAIFGVVIIWLWSWGVARGILRMSCASVIGAWYFTK